VNEEQEKEKKKSYAEMSRPVPAQGLVVCMCVGGEANHDTGTRYALTFHFIATGLDREYGVSM
jgi:hypothetical protein